MSIHVSDYSSSSFNRLDNFPDVLPKFDSIGGDGLVDTVMRDLFRRHRVESVFGLALLHKHWTLNSDERLTDIRGTSNPLTFDIGHPSIWRFDSESDQITPLEFSLDSRPIDWQASSIQSFLTEFQQCLLDKKASQIFGLCSYPGDGYPGRVEFSVGRSNINLTPKEAEWLPSHGTREAAWFFTDDFIKRGCKCNCLTGTVHSHSHGYTV